MPLFQIPATDEKRSGVKEGKMQRFSFKYLFFLMMLIGFSTNRCTNNRTDPEILPLDEGYKPDHAIEFPHEIHASKGIDCKYCHNPETDGKKAGIPAEKICMNCHKQVTGSSPEKNGN